MTQEMKDGHDVMYLNYTYGYGLCFSASCLNLPALSVRQKCITLCTMYKIVNNLTKFPPDIFIPRATSGNCASTSLYLQHFHIQIHISFLFSKCLLTVEQVAIISSIIKVSFLMSKRMATHSIIVIHHVLAKSTVYDFITIYSWLIPS